MPAKPKLTKFLLAYALSRSDNISRIARDLGVSRYTVYRSMKRWRLNAATVLCDPAPQPDTTPAVSTPRPQVPQVQAVEPKDEASKLDPERNILQFPISDFAGARLNEIPRGGRRYY